MSPQEERKYQAAVRVVDAIRAHLQDPKPSALDVEKTWKDIEEATADFDWLLELEGTT